MTKHYACEAFNPSHKPCKTEPSWAWDDIEPFSAREAAGYIVGTHCPFRVFAVIDGLPIQLGIFVGRAAACRAIVEAHEVDHVDNHRSLS